MKKYIFLFGLLVAAFSSSIAQTAATIYTPRSTSVAVISYASEPYSAAQLSSFTSSATQTYQNATFISSATGKYNCHSYAWNSQSTSNNKWMNSPEDDKYWLDGSYTFVPTAAQAQKWSYASVTNGDHSANTYSTSGTLTFRSKWGAWPVMQHAWNHCPYNSSILYGFESCPASTTSCRAPGSFTSSNLTATSVRLNYTRACNAAKYQVEYKLSSSSTWIGLTISNAPPGLYLSLNQNITNLQANKCYNFRIKVINGTATAYSNSISVCTPSASVLQRIIEEEDLSQRLTPSVDLGSEEAISIASEVEVLDNLKSIRIFPNPTVNSITLAINISDNEDYALVKVFNTVGTEMKSNEFDVSIGYNELILNTEDLARGLYTVQVSTRKYIYVEKLIKQ